MSQNRITQTLTACKNNHRKALVSYIVNGDPRPDVTLNVMRTLVKEGTDIIELGVPFSDPMAEGPVIQRGHERALEHSVSLKNTIELVAEFRQEDNKTPIVLMGYANPVERMGYKAFANNASMAGVDALLTVDLPPEESERLNTELKRVGLDNIFLIAPTTTEKRIEQITLLASGFIYYVSLKGVTGAGHLDIDSVSSKVKIIKKYTDLPLLVGFGIKDSHTAKAIGALSDGVVVGSLFVDAMGQDHNAPTDNICTKVAHLVKPIREGLDSL